MWIAESEYCVRSHNYPSFVSTCQYYTPTKLNMTTGTWGSGFPNMMLSLVRFHCGDVSRLDSIPSVWYKIEYSRNLGSVFDLYFFWFHNYYMARQRQSPRLQLDRRKARVRKKGKPGTRDFGILGNEFAKTCLQHFCIAKLSSITRCSMWRDMGEVLLYVWEIPQF